MTTISFADDETEKKALAYLIGRFSGKVLRSGEHLFPNDALEALALENIPFTVIGAATDEQQLRAINEGRSVARECMARSRLETGQLTQWLIDNQIELD